MGRFPAASGAGLQPSAGDLSAPRQRRCARTARTGYDGLLRRAHASAMLRRGAVHEPPRLPRRATLRASQRPRPRGTSPPSLKRCIPGAPKSSVTLGPPRGPARGPAAPASAPAAPARGGAKGEDKDRPGIPYLPSQHYPAAARRPRCTSRVDRQFGVVVRWCADDTVRTCAGAPRHHFGVRPILPSTTTPRLRRAAPAAPGGASCMTLDPAPRAGRPRQAARALPTSPGIDGAAPPRAYSPGWVFRRRRTNTPFRRSAKCHA